jgi:hypothetical protein
MTIKGFAERPYIWGGVILILLGTLIWLYGDRRAGAI